MLSITYATLTEVTFLQLSHSTKLETLDLQGMQALIAMFLHPITSGKARQHIPALRRLKVVGDSSTSESHRSVLADAIHSFVGPRLKHRGDQFADVALIENLTISGSLIDEHDHWYTDNIDTVDIVVTPTTP